MRICMKYQLACELFSLRIILQTRRTPWSVIRHIASSRLLVVGHCASAFRTRTAVHAVLLPHWIPLGGISQNRIISGRNWPTMKLQQWIETSECWKGNLGVNAVVEEINDRARVTIATVGETLNLWPEKFSEGKIINVTETRGCDEKEDWSEAMMVAKYFTLKESPWISHNVERGKNKRLEASPDLYLMKRKIYIWCINYSLIFFFYKMTC